jgi:hypothetical protein
MKKIIVAVVLCLALIGSMVVPVTAVNRQEIWPEP